MTSLDQRICSRTGLALVAGPVSALRIARESYGPLNPISRPHGESPEAWSRYDTPDRTIYACADPVTAYMELLAPYRTDVTAERRALQPIADAMGKDLDSLWHDIVAEIAGRTAEQEIKEFALAASGIGGLMACGI